MGRLGKAQNRTGRAKKAAPRPYHHGDLRQALIDAALEILSTGGEEPLTLREIARRAGVTHAAPYRHFADKQALLAAVAEDGFRGMHARMVEHMAPHPRGSLARLGACGVGYVTYAVDNPTHFRVMFGPGLLSARTSGSADYPGLAEAGGATFEALMTSVVEGQERGTIRPGDPQEIALASWSLVHGLAMLLVDGQLGLLDVGADRTQELTEKMSRLLQVGIAHSGP
jgi:AcrR family transcriptional regulator